MMKRRVGALPTLSRLCLPLIAMGLVTVHAADAGAQAAPAVTLGAGLQTSFLFNAPDGGDKTGTFAVNSARFYVNGPVANHVKFMFNTEYDGGTNHIGVLDAVARIETSPKMNLWFGRFLPPSDRANLYGPYYSNEWAVYTDGIQDGYPFVATGRDNGVMYWGQFGKVKVAGGAFDGASATHNTDILAAARVMVNLWDSEDGYYLNGTYYGAKNLLALGGAVQAQSGNTAATFDFLLEKKTKDGGAFTLESEYADYDGLGGYDGHYAKSTGGYVLASYLIGKPMGSGKVEFMGKFAQAKFTKGAGATNPDFTQKTTEVNVNYLLKEFNARLMFFFKNANFDAVHAKDNQVGVGLQIQM